MPLALIPLLVIAPGAVFLLKVAHVKLRERRAETCQISRWLRASLAARRAEVKLTTLTGLFITVSGGLLITFIVKAFHL